MDVICLDLEASGLGDDSYPIEVAWKNSADGDNDSFLINPDSVPGWVYWDECAEEIHGLCRAELRQQGVAAVTACERLNQRLAGQRVLSDAREYDNFWLMRLYQAANQQMAFQLVGADSVLTAQELEQFEQIAAAQLRQHRAMQDVDAILEALRQVKTRN